MKQKSFYWEGYNDGKEEYRFQDMTIKELKDWARNCDFKIEKRNNSIYVRGKYGTAIKWK